MAVIAQATHTISQGLDGVSAGSITIYQRSSTELTDAPADTVTTLSGIADSSWTVPTDWSKSIPSGTDSLYSSTAIFNATGDGTTSVTLDWSIPVPAGGEGAPGARGPGRWNIDVDAVTYASGTTTGALPASAADATEAWDEGVFTGTRPGDEVAGDQAWFFQGTDAAPTAQGVWIYNGTAWVEQSQVIDGNLLVDGTVTADNLATGSLTSAGIPSGAESGAFIDSDGNAFFGDADQYMRWDNTEGLTFNGVPVSVTVAATAPTNAREGDIFFYEDAGVTNQVQMFIFIEDADGHGGWVPTTASGDGLTPNMEAVSQGIETATSIDTDILDADSVIASRSLQVGNLVPTATATPASGSGMYVVGADDAGATGTTAGDLVVGNTDQFLGWDTSAGTLTIQGTISNISDAHLEGTAGQWTVLIPEGFSGALGRDLTNHLPVFIEGGPGLYRIMVTGSGGGGAQVVRGSRRAAGGGGAGAFAAFTYDWDGSEDMWVQMFTGGAGGIGNSNDPVSRTGVNTDIRFGNNASFNQATITVQVEGGGAGSYISGTGTGAGGAGGSTVTFNAHPNGAITDTVSRAGGAGGSGTNNTNVNNSVAAGGGGAVDFLGNGAANCAGQSVSRNNNATGAVAGSGGSPFGSGTLSVASNDQSSAAAAPTPLNPNGSSFNINGNGATIRSAAGGTTLMGTYLGVIPEGLSTGTAAHDGAQGVNDATWTTGGIVGGGSTAHSGNNSDSNWYGQSSLIFGGGGAGAQSSSDGLAFGGQGGLGGGGGAGGGVNPGGGGDGGDAAIFIQKL